MAFVSAGDVLKLGQVAFRLWEYGFSKFQNAEKQYADFGSDIHYLSRNLEKLTKVIQDVTRQIPQGLSPEKHEWDLKSLMKICGDFRKTIQECKTLLEGRSEFGRGRGGFIYNVRWGLSIESDVRRLRDRVAFHNVKINTVLKPLETKLLLDLKDDIYRVHGDLASRITDVHQTVIDVLRKIEGHWTINAQEASAQTSTNCTDVPRIPGFLEVRFELAAKTSNPDLDKDFPFYKGVDAFHHHFEQSTILFKPTEMSTADFFADRTPEPTQYLNLMKSMWIIQRIKKGGEWATTSKDRLTDCYMNEIEGKCLRELSRFTTKEEPRKRLTAPDQRNISLLREEEFRVWIEDEDEVDDFWSATDYLNEILRVPLLGSRHRTQELALVWQSDTKLQMRQTSSKISGAPNHNTIRDPINLLRARFVPLYADPSTPPEVLNVTFKGDDDSGEDRALSFLKLTDLLDFQQAITGYKVVYDDPDIRTLLFQSSGFLKSGRKTGEVGRVQIWSPRRLERLVPKVRSPVDDSFERRQSATTGSSSPASIAKTFSTAHTSFVENKDTVSYKFELPRLPIAVLYLQAEKSNKCDMSFLMIRLDEKTEVRPRCGCDRKKHNCIHATVSRPGELLARRISPRSGQRANLATLGEYQAPQDPDLERKLKYLHIEFRSRDDREGFEREFEQTKRIYDKKLARYYGEMSQEKKDHLG